MTKLLNERAWLTLEGANLDVGDSARVLCPFCKGGTTGEVSFVITRTDRGLNGHCYRATCSNFVYVKDRHTLTGQKGKKFNKRVYQGETYNPSKKLLARFNNTYQITPIEAKREGLKYTDNKRLSFPVYDEHGKSFGVLNKRTEYTTDNGPKWIAYFSRPTSKLHYPKANQGAVFERHIVLTEDIISAIRIAQFAPAVAILGTTLTWEQAAELARKTKRLILALDPDTGGLRAMVKIVKRYNALFKDGILIKALWYDPKDYPSDLLLKEHLGLLTNAGE